MSNLTTVQPTISQAISLPDWIRALYTIYLILILVIGLPGNIIIAVVYGRTAPKTACDWLIFTMGVTDAVVCLFSPMLHLRSEFEIEIPWLTGVWCGLDHWLQYTAMIASLIILVVVAVDRYVKICKPALHSLTPTMARHVCGWSIPVSAALCLFPTIDSFKDDLCVHARARALSRPTKIYYTCVFCVFVLSFFLVTFAYFSVCRRIGEKVKIKQRLLENDGLGTKAAAQTEARVYDPPGSDWWKVNLSCCNSSSHDNLKRGSQTDPESGKPFVSGGDCSDEASRYESAALIDGRLNSNSGLCPKISVQRPSSDQTSGIQTLANQLRPSNNKFTSHPTPQDGCTKQHPVDDVITNHNTLNQSTESENVNTVEQQTCTQTAGLDREINCDHVLGRSWHDLKDVNSENCSSSPAAERVQLPSLEEYSKHRDVETASGPRSEGEHRINYSCSYEISAPRRSPSADFPAIKGPWSGGGVGGCQNQDNGPANGRSFYSAQIDRGGQRWGGHFYNAIKEDDSASKPKPGSPEYLPWLRPFFLPSAAELKSPKSAGQPRPAHSNKKTAFNRSHKSMDDLCTGLAPSEMFSHFQSGIFKVHARKIVASKLSRSYSLSVLEFREYPEIRKSATQQNGDLDTGCQFGLESGQTDDTRIRLNYVETDDVMLGYDNAGTDDTVFRFDAAGIRERLGGDVPGVNFGSLYHQGDLELQSCASCSNNNKSTDPLCPGDTSPRLQPVATPPPAIESGKAFCYQNGVQGISHDQSNEKPDDLLVPPSPLPKSVLKPTGSVSSRTSGESAKSPTFAAPLPKISSREMDSELDDDEEALSDMATTIFLAKLRRHRSQGSKTSKSSVKSTGSRRRFARERQMTLMLLSVTAAFLLSWVPPWVIYMVSFYGPSYADRPVLEHVLFEHLTTVQLVNFVANPIIYYTFNPTFRLKVRGLMPSRPAKQCVCVHGS